jgi:hypothetical protein
MPAETTRVRWSSGASAHRVLSVAVLVVAIGAGPGLLAAQKADDKAKEKRTPRPSLTLKVSPPIVFSPARIVATAELKGGSDAEPDLYCPAVEWDWGDGTRSEVNADCEPFEAGESEIKRRWTASHTYTMGGQYRVVLRLKRDGRSVVAGNTTVTVRAGARDGFLQP